MQRKLSRYLGYARIPMYLVILYDKKGVDTVNQIPFTVLLRNSNIICYHKSLFLAVRIMSLSININVFVLQFGSQYLFQDGCWFGPFIITHLL